MGKNPTQLYKYILELRVEVNVYQQSLPYSLATSLPWIEEVMSTAVT